MAATCCRTNPGDIETLVFDEPVIHGMMFIAGRFLICSERGDHESTPTYLFYLFHHGEVCLVPIWLCHEKFTVTEFDIPVRIFSVLMNCGEVSIHDKCTSVGHSEIK
jgi:hypothetical protein